MRIHCWTTGWTADDIAIMASNDTCRDLIAEQQKKRKSGPPALQGGGAAGGYGGPALDEQGG